MARSIEWNQQGQDIIPPLERLRFERGEPNERLEGRLEVHGEHVWYRAGEHHKVVASVSGGDGGGDTAASSSAPAVAPKRKRKSKK